MTTLDGMAVNVSSVTACLGGHLGVPRLVVFKRVWKPPSQPCVCQGRCEKWASGRRRLMPTR